MKASLNWQDPKVVKIFDEVTLWSAPFGRLLLDNIPMQAQARVLDLGFGTGFPLIELRQRFGQSSTIYGMDIWEAGIERTQEKIEVLELQDIQILQQSAAQIPLQDGEIDLICSNVGINNFEEREKVYSECFRVLKKGGQLCLTTNPVGTLAELFALFESILADNNWDQKKLQDYVAHRGTQEQIVAEIEAVGFSLDKVVAEEAIMRFVEAQAVLDHSLMRFSFIDTWKNLVAIEHQDAFLAQLLARMEEVISSKGEFKITIPMLYLAFTK